MARVFIQCQYPKDEAIYSRLRLRPLLYGVSAKAGDALRCSRQNRAVVGGAFLTSSFWPQKPAYLPLVGSPAGREAKTCLCHGFGRQAAGCTGYA